MWFLLFVNDNKFYFLVMVIDCIYGDCMIFLFVILLVVDDVFDWFVVFVCCYFDVGYW